MKLYCTRPGCLGADRNNFTDLEDQMTLKTVQQKFCTTCGMPLILDGRYLPERLLGKGGFGTAFLAKDRRSPTLKYCVVKQFQPSSDFNPQQLATAQMLFEREAHVLEQLGNKHPQIPDLFAYFPLEAPGWHSSKPQQFFYIVQEYINGENLETELAAKGQFSEAEVQEVLEEILKILEFVHDHDVIHRDIKPSNIMRDRQGRLHLLDFGAVKQVTQSPGGTSTGIYSLGFAPPEQMRGYTVFPSTDLYALAATCLVLLTGKEPQELFDSYSDQWKWKQFVSVSDELAAILDKMLLPTPSDRFGSAPQVLSALNPPSILAIPQPSPVPSPAVSPGTTQLQPAVSNRFASPLELLSGAAFTGFELGVFSCLGFALFKVFNINPILLLVVILVGLSGLIFAQYHHWIERGIDFIIIPFISVGILYFILLKLNFYVILTIVPLITAIFAVAVTALFRLVYLILKRIL
ncbi:serine/threonine-protein kinase [Planktothrix mougeotii]|uniref:non-specific serine/threonine protein kinase n=1 Tax=Planktothrix mougeotii LEGE 06226 TaxID=1828728 RepID=A0ABR9UD72_9CYAN|nr:serine/threonine-protein kinase [Planktothrix mougeotii]MBE9143519.1 serine/threonine protein kinase [Planktothrix mougeotii LEGE 06226]